MNAWPQTADLHLRELEREVQSLSPRLGRKSLLKAACRTYGVLTATRYHLREPVGPAPTVFLGGTGTGKSTLLNRLLETEVSTVSFRRTYTNGAVAVVASNAVLPEDWLGIPHRSVEPLPVRGKGGTLTVVTLAHPLLEKKILVDTPDLDGECEEHPVEADRAFRWAKQLVFLVTPEKYQMTEGPPYYRLAARYELPALFLMNKCEEGATLEDYRDRLAEWGWPEAKVFAIPRDDSTFQPEPGMGLENFREALSAVREETASRRGSGLDHRCRDAAIRVRDQLLIPLVDDRKAADCLLASLEALSPASPDVDVSPFTERLRRRMREKSVLYLIGPARIADRVKNLYKTFFRGRKGALTPDGQGSDSTAPDFWQILVDQFVTAQSQFDDLVRSDPIGAQWIESDLDSYGTLKIDPAEAGKVAEREIEELGVWLEERWDANPKDTSAIEKLLKHLPGAGRLAKWSEAAPYLLLIVCAGSMSFLGVLDLLVIGGFSLGAWLGEKLSNEVTARVRVGNRKILQQYLALVNAQAERYKEWISQRSPTAEEIQRLEKHLEGLEECLEETDRE